MSKKLSLAGLICLLAVIPAAAYQSLQELYAAAEGYGQYDKYIELDPQVEYLGDLRISPGHIVFVDGHGAIIHGEGDNLINVGVSASTLNIQNCLFLGGLGGVYMGAQASGTIKNNTIIGCQEAGIRTYTIGSDNSVAVYDNIIIECLYGFFCNEYERPQYLGYNTVFNTQSHRYAEFCPG